ncbi:MAG TPA: hypothetical protein VFK79_15665 [Xanthobacteraceae bacterium]|nr:hypothetical protein [Xanthobacteraceae bacterium]
MPHIRLTAAAAAAAVVLAFAFSPATALPCNDGDAGCGATSAQAQAAPMELDNFMKTWKPAARSSKRAKRSKSVKRPAVQKPAVREIAAESAVAESAPPPAPVETLAASPEPSPETDAAGGTSFNEVNEIDAAGGKVQVVAFNEVNEIDLAAPAPPAPAESVGQSVSAQQPAADDSWMGKLLLAVAGTIALAGATRFLVA